MGTTTHYTLPYPVPADPANVPLDMQELADAIDSSLWAVQGLSGVLTVATTLAGLGAGASGKMGMLRPQPTTFNNGGAQALPAATLTVGDTSRFPTAGTLSTPNGTITYAGKTATTFTGCSGGTGTLAALAQIVLATGTPTAPVDDLPVIYDATLGKWVSPEFRWHVIQSGGDNLAAPAGGYGDIQPSGGGTDGTNPRIRWRDFANAGLAPQLRFAGVYWTNAVTSNKLGLGYAGQVDLASGRTATTDIPAAQITNLGNTGLYGYRAFDTGWQALPGTPTVADWLVIVPRGDGSGSGGVGLSNDMLAMLRWVG